MARRLDIRPIDLDIHGKKIPGPTTFDNEMQKAADANGKLIVIVNEGRKDQEIVCFENGEEELYERYYGMTAARFYILPDEKLKQLLSD